jgi:ABC-type transport system involved in multi-copper enzyme maturation permease subunit
MVLERQILPFFQWLFPGQTDQGLLAIGALLSFLLIVAGLAVASLFVAYVRCAILYGPVEGFYAVAKAVAVAISRDLPNTTFRRILAIARLAFQEAVRRRVLVGFAVFAPLLLFAGWFLDTDNDHPVRLYLSVVLTSTEWLILILAVLLSAFSIPQDVKTRTIYTVVTKPVRASEIVLGRILGFAAINTIILFVMAIISYVFVVRGLDHDHTLDPQTLQVDASLNLGEGVRSGETSFDAHHRHEVTVGSDNRGTISFTHDHQHRLLVEGEGADASFVVGPPVGALTAKVPVYGKLRFIDRAGREGSGINVGKEWTYREYIEGGSLASAVWTFRDIDENSFPNDIMPLEMNLSVFRTYKGDIVSGVLGSMKLRNPQTGRESNPISFTAKEFVTYQHDIPLDELTTFEQEEGVERPVDFYTELVDDEGRVELWIRCEEASQYFGMAQPDLWIRGPDVPFLWNFCKGYVGIWLQMLIVTCFGVVLSTFLSGPVALFATLVTYLVGYFKGFVISVATGETVGGGPLESMIRTATGKNLTIDLDMGVAVEILVKVIDRVTMFLMWIIANVFPDYRAFNTSQFVAYGFNIDGNLLAQNCVVALAYVLVLSVFGYFFLKSREIAG